MVFWSNVNFGYFQDTMRKVGQITAIEASYLHNVYDFGSFYMQVCINVNRTPNTVWPL